MIYAKLSRTDPFLSDLLNAYRFLFSFIFYKKWGYSYQINVVDYNNYQQMILLKCITIRFQYIPIFSRPIFSLESKFSYLVVSGFHSKILTNFAEQKRSEIKKKDSSWNPFRRLFENIFFQDQYQFCYRASLEYLGSFDHYAN